MEMRLYIFRTQHIAINFDTFVTESRNVLAKVVKKQKQANKHERWLEQCGSCRFFVQWAYWNAHTHTQLQSKYAFACFENCSVYMCFDFTRIKY